MRVLIMADMEGVSGLVHWDQVTNSHPMYAEGRRLFTEEINAAIRGAKKSGAKEIVVVDGHGAGAAALMAGPAFNSLIPELLDADCEFVTHHGWPTTRRCSRRVATPASSSASTRWRGHPTA
jgi:D-amino peptidase